MMNEPTIDKLHALRLAAMAEAWEQQNKSAKVADLGFDERFAMLGFAVKVLAGVADAETMR